VWGCGSCTWGWSLSVASGVCFIALAGLAAEFGVIMLIYLREAVNERPDFRDPSAITPQLKGEAIYANAVLRCVPKPDRRHHSRSLISPRCSGAKARDRRSSSVSRPRCSRAW
jgi:hypothetical protein